MAIEEVTIGNARLILGDCRDVLPTLAPVSAVVTDPPYGLRFMGKGWDYDVPDTDLWALVLDRLLPGGHLLAFAGTRTQHRMAVRIEDGGFEIRDMLAWVYGSGFPKSLDVGKAIDKAAGVEREVVGPKVYGDGHVQNHGGSGRDDIKQPYSGGYSLVRQGGTAMNTAPATEAARQWQGWGTALKPAFEPITLARKPLVGTVAKNVQEYGAGALNIDGCRVDGGDANPSVARRESAAKSGKGGGDMHSAMNKRLGIAPFNKDIARFARARPGEVAGRWPANLIHDGSDEVVALFPQTGPSSAAIRNNAAFKSVAKGADKPHQTGGHADNGGSAARFFYCAKAAAAERGAGNDHPTVKPIALMRWLLTLVTPPGGVVLDPFLGSGSTGVAAADLGVRFVGIERERRYFDIACERIARAQAQGALELPDQAPPMPARGTA